MLRSFIFAQRAVGSKCTVPAKSASASYAVPADVASTVHSNPHECSSFNDDLEFYRFRRWGEREGHREVREVWNWGVEVIGSGHLAVIRTRRPDAINHRDDREVESCKKAWFKKRRMWLLKHRQGDSVDGHHDGGLHGDGYRSDGYRGDGNHGGRCHNWRERWRAWHLQHHLNNARGSDGCHGDRYNRDGNHGRGCEQEWRDRWKMCRHDMWSSCNRTWHFLEAVGWGTAAVLGYQISNRRKDNDRSRRELDQENQCIVKRLYAALTSVLPLTWPCPRGSSPSLMASFVLPHMTSAPQQPAGAEHTAFKVEQSAATSERKTFHTLLDINDHTLNFKFDKYHFLPKVLDVEHQLSAAELSSPVDSSSSAAPSVEGHAPHVDVLMKEIVNDWQSLARDYCASLDNAVAVSKAKHGCLEEAVESWLRIVEETDNAKALFNLALSYEQGLGTAQDIRKAMEYYKRATAKGNPKAAFNLAMMMLRENDVARIEEVRELLTLAASHGLPEAQRELAYLYAEDSPPNLTEAVLLFQQAADKNDVHSCYNLALCYDEGMGVERDECKALEWFEKAALSGHPDALFSLASYHEHGRANLSADKDKAIVLYQAAQREGNKEAGDCMSRLKKELSITSNKGYGKDFLQVPFNSPTDLTRNVSSSIIFSRLLSTGSDASDLSSSYNEDVDDSEGWESDDNTKKEVKHQRAGHPTRDDMMMFGKKSSLRTGFFVGFSSDEEEGIGSEVEVF